ncbi:MAG TPA: hypothetical protein VII75_09585 [Thermoanaerobaculia bacterium]
MKTAIAFLCLFMSVAAAAQRTDAVKIQLLGTACSDLHTVLLVLKGDEENAIRIDDFNKKAVWSSDGTDLPIPFIDVKGTPASLRLGGRRTNCVASAPDKFNDKLTAVFVFHCDENPAWNVKINTWPPIGFRYERSLPGCDKEQAHYEGVATAPDVRFYSETLDLFFGTLPFSLRVNDYPIVEHNVDLDHRHVAAKIVPKIPGAQLSPNSYEVKIAGLTTLRMTVK